MTLRSPKLPHPTDAAFESQFIGLTVAQGDEHVEGSGRELLADEALSINAAGRRLCPACEIEQTVPPGEPLWPRGWRCHACTHVVPVIDGFPHFALHLASDGTEFDAAAFQELARAEPGHFWFVPRNHLLTGVAMRFFPAATRYLEIGCGSGMVLSAMASKRLWSRLAGAELHTAGLRHARDRLGSRAELVQMDARRIPARDAFDLIGAFDVLEHIVEDETVLREVHAALAPGGGFIAAVPQHPALWSQADVVGGHVRRYRRGELEEKLRRAKFEILFSTSYASVVLPMMIVSRLTMRTAVEPERPTSRCELSVSPLLNKILGSVLNAEVGLTLRGVRWPVGGSRVVVARKFVDNCQINNY